MTRLASNPARRRRGGHPARRCPSVAVSRVRGRGGGHWQGRGGRRRRSASRSHRARPRPAGPGRHRSVPSHQEGVESAHRDPLGAWRRSGQGGGARHRRGRLCDQAVRVRGVAGADSRGPPTAGRQRRSRSRAHRGGGPDHRLQQATRRCEATRRSGSHPRSSSCWRCWRTTWTAC